MNPRDRRAITVGTTLVVAGLLLFRVIPGVWHHWKSGRETLLAQRALLARTEQALARFDQLEDEAERTRGRFVGLAPRLISGRTGAEAQADLNGRVALIANRERTRMLRADPLPDSTLVSQLRRVRLRVEVESDWSGLVGFLRGVVADPAALRVTSISLRGVEVPTSNPGPEVITGEIEVTGWYLDRDAVRPEEGQ